jgi:hypothetical protein
LGFGFTISGVNGTLNGFNQSFDLSFYDPSIGGGFDLDPGLSLAGPQLYSGPSSSPTFLTGNFNLTNYPGQDGSYSLSISSVGGAVPEPATWAMMLLGFGFVGGAMRTAKRRQKVTVSYA